MISWPGKSTEPAVSMRIFCMNFTLNRRAFLRSISSGVATGLALPVLECMVNSQGRFVSVAQAANVAAPVRYLGFMIQNGAPGNVQNANAPNSFFPVRQSNGTLALNTAFNSIAHLKTDFNQITNLDARILRNDNDGFIEHTNGQRGFWTGKKMRDDGQGAGPSMEWVLGKALGQGVTKYPCLSLSLPRGWSDRMDTIGKNTWVDNGQPGTYLYTPKMLADKLFSGLGAQTDNTADKRNASILDQYMTDTKALQAKLSAQDRARLDQHLTTVRQIEQQLAVVNNLCRPLSGSFVDVPTGGLNAVQQKSITEAVMPVMSQLVVFAFQCDLTRYILFEVANATPIDPAHNPAEDVDNNPSMNDHFWSHDPADRESGTGKSAYYFDQKMKYWATFLDAMKASPENDKSLLYNSISLLGSDVACGNHQMYNYPIIQAGQAGGRIKTGQIIEAGPRPDESVRGTTINNLHATLLTAAGLPTTKFGDDGTGRIPGLLV